MNISKYRLSIAVVTRNRPESLERMLESLFQQHVKPFEVVISDDSDSEVAIIANKGLAERYECRYVTGPKRGLYANRNFVAKECLGTHFRTMDDDHEFPEKHIQVCMDAIESDPEAIWTIGEYCPPNPDRSLPAPVPGQLHPMGYSYAPDDMSKYFGISCGASIYPRTVIDKNVLNLETYMFGILYLEYGARLKKRGFHFKHIENTFVIHNVDMDAVNNRSVMSVNVINGAKVFSMMMLSFHHQKTFKNIVLTSYAILKDIIMGKYSFKLVLDSFYKYKKALS
jgi:Glycosyltransferases involved in cell wall biogenesis